MTKYIQIDIHIDRDTDTDTLLPGGSILLQHKYHCESVANRIAGFGSYGGVKMRTLEVPNGPLTGAHKSVSGVEQEQQGKRDSASEWVSRGAANNSSFGFSFFLSAFALSSGHQAAI